MTIHKTILASLEVLFYLIQRIKHRNTNKMRRRAYIPHRATKDSAKELNEMEINNMLYRVQNNVLKDAHQNGEKSERTQNFNKEKIQKRTHLN